MKDMGDGAFVSVRVRCVAQHESDLMLVATPYGAALTGLKPSNLDGSRLQELRHG